jgi:predicted transcriptional regulator
MLLLLEDDIAVDFESGNEVLDASIKRGLDELEKGMGIPHDVAMAEIRNDVDHEL